jgi:CRP/FNR family transcriptional regulator
MNEEPNNKNTSIGGPLLQPINQDLNSKQAAASVLISAPAEKKSPSTSTEKRTAGALEFLQSLNELKDIPGEALQLMSAFSHFETYKAGQFLVNEGQEESRFGYIVATGRVSVLKSSHNGRDLIVELLQPGDMFGLLLNLVAERLPAELSARALQKTTVLWVPVHAFLNVTAKYPNLLKDFTAHLLTCLQSSYCLSRGLAHDQVDVRIAALLCSLTLKCPERMLPNEGIEIHFTRQQLADLVGTTPETAIRVTRAMEKKNILSLTRPGIIHVLDTERLEDMVDDSL